MAWFPNWHPLVLRWIDSKLIKISQHLKYNFENATDFQDSLMTVPCQNSCQFLLTAKEDK
jgi:hypothetical protein